MFLGFLYSSAWANIERLLKKNQNNTFDLGDRIENRLEEFRTYRPVCIYILP